MLSIFDRIQDPNHLKTNMWGKIIRLLLTVNIGSTDFSVLIEIRKPHKFHFVAIHSAAIADDWPQLQGTAVVSNGRIFYMSQASGFAVSQTFGSASTKLPAIWERE